MALEDEIKQKKFKNEYEKMLVNLLYTTGWLLKQQSVIFKPYGLTTAQYNVLRILRGQYPKPATINLIIDRMLDKMSNASRIVDKLELKKLVVRKQSASDRRAVDVYISEKGLEILAVLDIEMAKFQESMKGISTEQAKIVNDLLDKLRTEGT